MESSTFAASFLGMGSDFIFCDEANLDIFLFQLLLSTQVKSCMNQQIFDRKVISKL